MENMPTITEQLRFMAEQLQFQSAKMLKLEKDINRNWCRIYGFFILLVIGVVSVMKMQ
ncbi:unnamed protein product [Camellia sinensis]